MKEFISAETKRKIALFLRDAVTPQFFVGLLGCAALSATGRLHTLRIGTIKTERMGHFVMDTSIRFAEQSSESKPPALFWVNPKEKPANSFWFEMFRRNFRTTESWVVGGVAKVASILPQTPKWFIPPPWKASSSRDTQGLISRSQKTMAFTASENQAGGNWLRKIGCKTGQPFVCLLVRDSEYLSSDSSHNPTLNQRTKDFWSYHNYRDSDVSTYLEAAEWLADNGFFVLRMGKTMGKRFFSDRPQIVDYAFHPDKSDFLDVWLFANCSICITTGTGPDFISLVYQKPAVAVNYIPMSNSWTSVPVITAGKALYGQDGKRLSLEEHLTLHLSRSEDYEEQGVRIRDLSGPEILAVVKESIQRINGIWHDESGDRIIQERFKAILSRFAFRQLHGYFHPNARPSTAWVRQLDQERSQGKQG